MLHATRLRRLVPALVVATSVAGIAAPAQAAPAQGTLTIVTTPDPTPADARAYVHGSVPITASPAITARRPDGSQWSVTASALPSGWWVADLHDPRGITAGTYRVDVRAATGSGELSGTSTYVVVPDTEPGPPGNGWVGIGPNSQGGEMTTFAHDPSRMIVRPGNSRHLFETTDGGASWRVRDRIPVADGVVTKLLADPARPGRLWAAVSSQGRDPVYAGRVYVSDDNGSNWRDAGAPNVSYRDLQIDATGQILVLVSELARGNSDVHVSRDAGRTWTKLDLAAGLVSPVALVGDALYLPTQKQGIVRVAPIADPDATPKSIFAGASFPWMRGVAVNRQVIVANSQFEGVWASVDQGGTWARIRPPAAGATITLVKLLGDEIIVADTDEYHLSSDFGRTWQDSPLPWSTTFAVDATRWGKGKDASLYLASNGAGNVRIRDGKVERVGTPGVFGHDIAVTETAGALGVVVGTERDSYATVLPARAASPVSPEWGNSGAEGVNGRATVQVAAAGASGVVYKVRQLASGISVLLRSDDAGKTWREVAGFGVSLVHALVAHPTHPDTVVASVLTNNGEDVRTSTDGGATWQVTALDAPLMVLAIHPTDPTRFYGGGPSGLWASTDRGDTVERVNTQPVDLLALAPSSPDRLVVATAGQVYSSDDAGRTLISKQATGPIGSPQSPVMIRELAISPRDPDMIVAATGSWRQETLVKGGHGVLRSDDGGRTWREFSTGLSDLDIRALAFAPDGRSLFALTPQSGAYRIRL